MTSLFRMASVFGLVFAASSLAACGGSSSEPTSTSSSDALKHHKSSSSSGGSESCGCDDDNQGSGGKCEYTCSAYGYAEHQCEQGVDTFFLCQDGCITNVTSCPASSGSGGGSSGSGSSSGSSGGSSSGGSSANGGGSSGGGFGAVNCSGGDPEVGQYVAPCVDEGLTAAGQCVEGSMNGGDVAWTCNSTGCATGLAGVGCGATTNLSP